MVNLLQQQTPYDLLSFYLCVCVCMCAEDISQSPRSSKSSSNLILKVCWFHAIGHTGNESSRDGKESYTFIHPFLPSFIISLMTDG